MYRRVLGSALLASLASGFVVVAAQAPVSPPAVFATRLAVTTTTLSDLLTALERSGGLVLRTVRRCWSGAATNISTD